MRKANLHPYWPAGRGAELRAREKARISKRARLRAKQSRKVVNQPPIAQEGHSVLVECFTGFS